MFVNVLCYVVHYTEVDEKLVFVVRVFHHFEIQIKSQMCSFQVIFQEAVC